MRRSGDPNEDERLQQVLEAYIDGQAPQSFAKILELCDGDPKLLAAAEECIGYLPNPGHCDPWIGRVLGNRYKLTRRLGAGAMGIVFAAKDLQLEREVAVKVLEKIWTTDPQRCARFQREVLHLAKINDPSILSVYDFCLEELPPFFVTELICGKDLHALIAELHARAKTPASQTDYNEALSALMGGWHPHSKLERMCRAARSWADFVARIAISMTESVVKAHNAGVLHRDIKPSNFMLDVEGRVRLLDFGLAKTAQDPTLTQEQDSVGSPRYMAPEVVAGAPHSVASDIHSLGATIYELLTLRPIFDESGNALRESILYETPIPAHELCPRIPRALSAVIAKCLRKSPTQRYSNADDLLEDLRRFERLEPVQAQPSRLPPFLRCGIGKWRRHGPSPRMLGITIAAGLVLVSSLSVWIGGDLAEAEAHATSERQRLTRRLSPTLGLDRTAELRRSSPNRALQRRDLHKLTELSPEAPGIRFLALRFAIDDRDPESQSRHLSALQSLVSRNELRRWQRTFEALAGRHEHEAGRAAAAIAALEHLGEDPLPDVLELRLRGMTLLELGRFGDAITLARRIGSEHGERADALFVEGVALAALDRERSRSLDLLRRARELCPDHLPTIHNLARQLRRLGQAAEAMQILQVALQRDPQHDKTLDLEALILRDLHAWERLEQRLRSWPEPLSEQASLQRGNAALRRALLAWPSPSDADTLMLARRELQRAAKSSQTPIRRAASRNLALVMMLESRESKRSLDAVLQLALDAPTDPLLGRHMAYALVGTQPSATQSRQLAALTWMRQLELGQAGPKALPALVEALAPIDPERALHCLVRFADLGPMTTQLQHSVALLLREHLSPKLSRRWRARLQHAGILPRANSDKEHQR